jgi:hypothetical protein
MYVCDVHVSAEARVYACVRDMRHEFNAQHADHIHSYVLHRRIV